MSNLFAGESKKIMVAIEIYDLFRMQINKEPEFYEKVGKLRTTIKIGFHILNSTWNHWRSSRNRGPIL